MSCGIAAIAPITTARDGILVDGLHRWQAHRREKAPDIAAINLGDLSDLEIRIEAIRRNNPHGVPFITQEKRKATDQLYRDGMRDEAEMAALLSLTQGMLKEYLRDAKRDEKEAQQALVWDLRLNCLSEREIEDATGTARAILQGWLTEKRKDSFFGSPPAWLRAKNPKYWGRVQHFDVWEFQDGGDGSYFGRMPPQVVQNLLRYYTEPDDIVVDPLAGGGATIDAPRRCAAE